VAPGRGRRALITSVAVRIVAALKPGGILVVENFQRDINRPGAVGGAPLGYAANELLTAFGVPSSGFIVTDAKWSRLATVYSPDGSGDIRPMKDDDRPY
jgi:hypothetical protein